MEAVALVEVDRPNGKCVMYACGEGDGGGLSITLQPFSGWSTTRRRESWGGICLLLESVTRHGFRGTRRIKL